MTAPAAEAKAVVIVGGGFGGLSTALALSRQHPRPPILLIEPNDRFVFLPLLYELFSGELQAWEVAPRYEQLLQSCGIARIQDRVTAINSDQHTVQTAGGACLPYGQLVLASGSEPEDFGIPGVRDYALHFHSLHDVEVLRERVRQLKRRPHPMQPHIDGDQGLVIVGAGATGVELACKLADLLDGAAPVHLVERGGEILPLAKAFNREQASQALAKRGVQVHLNRAVQSVGPDSLILSPIDPGQSTSHGIAAEESLRHGGLIWTAGTRPRLPALTPTPPSRGGRLLVDDTLCTLASTDLLAIGDVAAHDLHDEAATDWPRTAQVALQQGEAAARCVMALRSGHQPAAFQFRDLGEMLSLGLGEATITGLGMTLAGPLAFRLRRLTYLARLPGLSLGLRSAGAWILGG